MRHREGVWGTERLPLFCLGQIITIRRMSDWGKDMSCRQTIKKRGGQSAGKPAAAVCGGAGSSFVEWLSADASAESLLRITVPIVMRPMSYGGDMQPG